MRPKIGAHVSAAGGLSKAVGNAKKIGAECIQIFGASPRQWRGALPSRQQIEKFKKEAKENKVDRVYLHASYLVNLASPKVYNRQQSILSLEDHLKIAELLGARGLIFHLGSGGEELSKSEAEKQTVLAMRKILKSAPGKAKLIMENSAGGGRKLGLGLGEIGRIFKKVGSSRTGICFDTAHALEAGLIKQYTKENIKALFDQFEAAIGLKNLSALHLNDSKTDYNSHHDRHENIGQGFIGLTGFKNLAKEKRLLSKDWILEVPGFDNQGPDKKNLDLVKSFFKRSYFKSAI